MCVWLHLLNAAHQRLVAQARPPARPLAPPSGVHDWGRPGVDGLHGGQAQRQEDPQDWGDGGCARPLLAPLAPSLHAPSSDRTRTQAQPRGRPVPAHLCQHRRVCPILAQVVAGFAGSAADGLSLLERLEAKLEVGPVLRLHGL